MERIKNLDRFQKIILLLLSAMLVIFAVTYAVVSSRVGFSYRDTILLPQEVDGNMVYSGRIYGETATFTVTQDKVVAYCYGDKQYGPYTVREDPSAIPEDSDLADLMTGIEIRNGTTVFFRGGVLTLNNSDSEIMLFEEDGSFSSVNVTVSASNGIIYDSEGNVVDQMAPSPQTILRLVDDPELTRKGEWIAWFGGVFISALTAVSILFADGLFRFNLSFRVRNADRAEPSEWEIAQRYISWIALPIMALVLYMMGLTA